jgi:hypothetical protein
MKMSRIGMDARSDPAFAPTIASTPPEKSFSSIVFASSRDFCGLIFLRSDGVEVNIGVSRCRLLRLATLSVGHSAIIGPGLWSIV